MANNIITEGQRIEFAIVASGVDAGRGDGVRKDLLEIAAGFCRSAHLLHGLEVEVISHAIPCPLHLGSTYYSSRRRNNTVKSHHYSLNVFASHRPVPSPPREARCTDVRE